jgi:hypothetical protein
MDCEASILDDEGNMKFNSPEDSKQEKNEN